MDTRRSRKGKSAGNLQATPEGSSVMKGARLESLTKSYMKSNKSPLRFATKEEMERRENDEVWGKHGNPIIAFEEKDGATLCEKCVYTGQVEKPVFTAIVAKQIKKRFDTEFTIFEKLCDELMSINQTEVRNRIQESVTMFFDEIRTKCDELEEKTVAKIENSKNLNELVSILDETHGYMEKNWVAEKYDSERIKLDVKVSDVRYTYVCQRKQHYDGIIDQIEGDNKKLADAVEKARRMIMAIYDCDNNEKTVQNTLNDLVSSLIKIDQKHPDYVDMSDTERKKKNHSSVEENKEETDLIKHEINFSSSEHKEGNWKAEEMTEWYFAKETTLCKRVLDGEKVVEEEIMKLKLHLQKIMTVPVGKHNKVFLMGGSKDPEGKQAIHNCYEVKNKTMTIVDKLSTPKLSFAAALSPDAKQIYIAGGSTGENKATNQCEVFNVAKKKWTKMPALNQPRFSASLIVCENTDIYCFGGVDNDPRDPTKFSTLKSIETLNLGDDAKEWEVLKLCLPYKTSSPGAISLGHRAFVVFGGWNKDTLSNSVIIRTLANGEEYGTEPAGEMAKEDSFVANGLVARDAQAQNTIIFGTNFMHQYHQSTKSFSIIE